MVLAAAGSTYAADTAAATARTVAGLIALPLYLLFVA